MTLNTVRWTARVLGTAVVLFVLFFLFGHIFGDEDGLPLTLEVSITFLFFPVSTIIGLSVAWIKEGLGGLVTLIGLAGLLIMAPDLATNYVLIGSVAFPAILYIIYWRLKRK